MSGSSTVTAAGGESGTPLVSRGVTKVVTSHKQREGGGFVVRRPVGGAELSQLSPFLMLDHLGKAERHKLYPRWHAVTSTFTTSPRSCGLSLMIDLTRTEI
jgi:hypothetical protein